MALGIYQSIDSQYLCERMQQINELPNELQQCARTNTPLGIVVVLGFHVPIPTGWERLMPEDGRKIMNNLKTVLSDWSIIAFQFGALTGPGYGCHINDSYGTQCGEGFIIRKNAKYVEQQRGWNQNSNQDE